MKYFTVISHTNFVWYCCSCINTSGAVDSLNTQHCMLLKHRINSQTHLESIQCFRSTQYAITSNVSYVLSIHICDSSIQDISAETIPIPESNTFASETFVQESESRVPSTHDVEVREETSEFCWTKHLMRNIAWILLCHGRVSNCFIRMIVISAHKLTNGTDFSFLFKLHK